MATTTVIATILFNAKIDTAMSQSMPSTTMLPEQENAFPSSWIYGMVITGFAGIILITAMCCHSMYNFYKRKLLTKTARALYIVFFLSYLTTCIAYALFRMDLILPMGTQISCATGYYLTTNSVYFSKLMLFIIFIYRIDIAFHTSALGYPRSLLICIAFAYISITTTLNITWVFVTKDLITFQASSYFNGLVTGICTTGSDESKYTGLYTLTLGLMFLGDMLFNILVSSLFIHKLRIVVKMAEDGSHRRKAELHRGSTDHKNDKLKKVMRKQTSLVLLACLSTMLILGLGAVLSGFSLMMPLDATVNVFCVWLMFTFSDKVWNKMMKSCCCCCKCIETHDLLMTLHSITRRFSHHPHDDEPISVSSNENVSSKENNVSSKENHNIPIDFSNAKHIKMEDVKKPSDKGDKDQDEEEDGIEVKYK